MSHEAIIATKVGKDGARFGAREDDRQPGGAAHSLQARDEVKFAIEYLLIKEKQGAQGLVLSGGGDGSVDGQMIEEGANVLFAHFVRVAFAVEEDVAPDPIDVGLLGPNAVMLDPQMPADPVEQFGLGRRKELGGHRSGMIVLNLATNRKLESATHWGSGAGGARQSFADVPRVKSGWIKRGSVDAAALGGSWRAAEFCMMDARREASEKSGARKSFAHLPGLRQSFAHLPELRKRARLARRGMRGAT